MHNLNGCIDNMQDLNVAPNESSLNDSDSDYSCSDEEISSRFSSKCRIITKVAACTSNKYILHISGSRESCPNVILGLSNNTSEVYKFDNNHLAKLSTFEVSDRVVDVKSHPNNNNLFYVGSNSCEVMLWDLRTPSKATSIFTDTSLEDGNKFKPMTCFDVSPNNRLLAAGTEVHEGDSFILFWDIRNTKMLGGYWESHMDDITQVKFHPDDVNRMLSGSTDGLVNVYDLSQSSEDDALIDSLNTESSVERLFWYSQGNSDFICCTFHTNDMQLWKSDDVQPYAYFSREDLTKHISRKTSDDTYIAGAYTTVSNALSILLGSTARGGKCLRSFAFNKTGLQPMCDFKENKQIVRSCWYSNEANIVVTGGEKGVVNIWEVDRYI